MVQSFKEVRYQNSLPTSCVSIVAKDTLRPKSGHAVSATVQFTPGKVSYLK